MIALAMPAPSSTPSAVPAASTANESYNQKEQHRADSGVDDCSDDASAEVDAELRQQPPADKGTHDADDKVIDDPVSSAGHDLSGKPSCNETDREYEGETFTRPDTLSIFAIARTATIPMSQKP